jgi:hypothetical protein
MSNKAVFSLIILAVASVIFSIESCKPKSSDAVEPDSLSADSLVNSTCILLSERINDVLYRAYEYDTARTLLRMVEYSANANFNRVTKRFRFDYDKNELVRITETNLAARDQSMIYELDYDSDKVLKTIRPFRVFNSGPRAMDTLTVKYDQRAYINELSSTRTGTKKWQYDSLGNVKKYTLRLPNATTDSTLAEFSSYDNKINLFAFSRAIQILRLLTGQAPSRRNPLSFVEFGQDVQATYLYNNQNVPTQGVFKSKALGDTVLRETVRSYQLNCK